MRALFRLAVSLTAISFNAAVSAQSNEAASGWRTLTLADVNAAHRMLLEDHPGASRPIGDDLFKQRLATAFAVAQRRAAKTSSYEGYVATLAEFAGSLGDKHIWSNPAFGAKGASWAGLLIALHGRDWVVADDANPEPGPSLRNAKLIGCDGIPAEQLARQRLDKFKVFWPIRAQRVQSAFWLLLDDGNPFLKRPRSCTFSLQSKQRSVMLNWRPVSRGEFGERLSKVPYHGEAGYGVRKVASRGYWIGLQGLTAEAQKVIADVKAQAPQLQQADYVVLDLRGNEGGNSVFGRLIANALLGEKAVEARLGPSTEDCSIWRLSPRNVRQAKYYHDELMPSQGREASQQFAPAYARIMAAAAARQLFSGPVRCEKRKVTNTLDQAAAASRLRGRLILLTDVSCFSSCLLVTDEFRRLGALHIGQETDANTNYAEVREDKLPSGLSTFSTLQAVDLAQPAAIGPFAPEVTYPGDIADTASLERWVEGLME